MYRTGHYGVSLLVYAPVLGVLLLLDRRAFAAAGLIGMLALARVPDYDQSIPFVRHRGPTHTFAFAWLVGVLLALAGAAVAPNTTLDRVALGGFGLLVGVLGITAHLAGDILTPAGIEPLWPFSRRNYSLHVATADNPIANYGLLAAGIAATVGVALSTAA
ncbi:metal-dependent hydrolase [Halocalculus aciditolerans]|uniref:Inner membrane protein n=1 Tax=Halocalculus aciditolerans TaxID=1383812 RepID=A0A830FBL2_9EURY|nr:metal-dependent hydrolase [Halocalculus aciditolerans]GGL58300.1 hypothetical protein GCM10009039_15700 [Halocalculus aciditolerans]